MMAGVVVGHVIPFQRVEMARRPFPSRFTISYYYYEPGRTSDRRAACRSATTTTRQQANGEEGKEHRTGKQEGRSLCSIVVIIIPTL